MHETLTASTQRHYTPGELWADGVVHVLGCVFAVVGSFVLVFLLAGEVSGAVFAAVAVYLLSLVGSTGISAAYNISPASSAFKRLLRRFDHSAIFLLIAGTYTPFLVKAGSGIMLVVVWSIAAFGVLLKLAAPGRLDRLSILIYLGLGWSGVAVLGTLTATLSPMILALILAGGVVYSLGVSFHLWERLPFQNAIWHACVLVAAGLHFAAVWLCSVC